VHSIGAGTYDAQKAAADPADPAAGNVPYTIAGLPVKDLVSFYYESEYALTTPRTHKRVTCVDMRAGCPAVAPATP
jgi:hypothetical protein